MSEYLLYIAKSTICLSVLFGLYYFLLRKETFFTLNRRILIFTVLFAAFTPLFYTPECLKSTINLSIIPDEPSLVVSELIEKASVDEDIIKEENSALNNLSLNKLGTAAKTVNETHLTENKVRYFQVSYIQILTFIYFLGFIISVICSFIGIIKTLNIIRKAKKIKYKSYYLSVLATDVSSFSFGRYIILSKHDFDNNKEEILTHEEAHVGLRHSLDLLLVECFKSIYWFNPVIYMIIKNLKEIHEYQADQFTLNKGVDARQYQLLIIKKSVGYEQFALANSFHHCQIKKRITMINKKESKRIWKWKAAVFLPVTCVLLMSFSNKLENPEIKKTLDIKELTVKKNKVRHWTEADFMDASIDKKAYLETPYTVSVLVDQDYGIIVEQDVLRNKKIIKSQTVYHTEKYDDDFFIDNLENYERVIKKTINFKNASYQLKKQFKQVVVNGKKEMVSNYKIVISRGEYVSDSEYQKAFDLVGRTIESVKNNFSKERYSREYRELVRDEKNTIDKLVPIKVFYLNDRYKKPLTRIERLFKFNTSNYSKVISLRKNNLVFLYNEFHNLYLNGHITWQLSNNRTRYIWKYFDYSCVDNSTKNLFKEVIINGVKLMAPTANIYVEHENTTLQKSGIECLNQLVSHISKIFLRIKEKNSKLVYSKSYADLSLNEKANIDSLLPNKIISGGKELHFAKGIKAVSKQNKVYLVEKH